MATEEIFEAATLPSRPYGDLLPSEQPHLSFAERVPVGVVGVICAVQLPADPCHPVSRACAGAWQRGDTQAGPAHGSVCGGVVLARVFEEAGLPAGLLHVLPGGADVG